MVGSLGATFNISALRTIGNISRYVLPTDGLWHGAIYHLEPAALLSERLAGGRENNPFFAQAGPSWGYLVWVAAWFLLVLGAGVVSIERREL